MKRLTLAICAIAFLMVACNNAAKNETASTDSSKSTTSTDVDHEKEWVPMDTAKMWPAMMEYGKVGPHHERLAKSNGNWTGEVVMWMSDGGPADTSVANVSNKMVMGNRYQISNYSGNMMDMPFEGQSTTGYDNAKKVYMSTWIDNMSSGIMEMEGPYDEATKTITMTGKMVSPYDGRVCSLKQTYRFVDDKTEVMEMWGPDSQTGKQYKTMQITLRRK